MILLRTMNVLAATWLLNACCGSISQLALVSAGSLPDKERALTVANACVSTLNTSYEYVKVSSDGIDRVVGWIDKPSKVHVLWGNVVKVIVPLKSHDYDQRLVIVTFTDARKEVAGEALATTDGDVTFTCDGTKYHRDDLILALATLVGRNKVQ